MKSIPKLLSKTKLMRGFRCQKCIYLTVHRPELEPPITPDTQALFDQGNLVGETARKYFPNGVLVENVAWDFIGAINKTRELIANKHEVIFEAAFEYKGSYARADILQYSPETNRWRIYEVKSTTKVKPEHITDISLQTWIMAKYGLPIEKINIMHLNSACRYPDLNNLFKTEDVTDEVRKTYLSIQPKVHEIFTTVYQPNIPNVDIGPQCFQPNECSFSAHCLNEKKIPPLSVLNLPGIRDRKWELYNNGIIQLDDSRLTDLNELQERVVQAFKTGERYINIEGIKQELSQWKFPLVFLDFETINPAIPRYQGCGPYQQVPFQFSVHTWEHPNAELTHEEFLHDTADDPRDTLIPALLQACGTEGSVVAYFAKFESARINELIAYAPEHSNALSELLNRIVDPLPIIRDYIYDNAFSGSFSLKKVSPALLGDQHSYEGMMVGNGNDAQRAFEELISSKTSVMKKDVLRKAMIEYCKKDTYVMVELVKWLFNVTK